MLRTITLVILVGVVVGAAAELVRSGPDPDLWSQESSGVIVGVVAGAIAALVVLPRSKDRG